jgi:hypothetical protein
MPEDVLRFISLEEARHREGDRGRTTQYRTRRTDPDYPEVHYVGERGYLLEHEHQQYLLKLIDRSRRGGRHRRADRQLEPDVEAQS